MFFYEVRKRTGQTLLRVLLCLVLWDMLWEMSQETVKVTACAETRRSVLRNQMCCNVTEYGETPDCDITVVRN